MQLGIGALNAGAGVIKGLVGISNNAIRDARTVEMTGGGNATRIMTTFPLLCDDYGENSGVCASSKRMATRKSCCGGL